jgi:hypothetical protein
MIKPLITVFTIFPVFNAESWASKDWISLISIG